MEHPTVLIAVPQPLRDRILSDGALARLCSFAHVRLNDDGRNWLNHEIGAKLPGVHALITSWGSPGLDTEALAAADKLMIIAHAAGSIKFLATDEIFDRGIVITHAAARIADSVAEYALLMAMMGLRQPHVFDHQLKAGVAWPEDPAIGTHEIAGQKVGLLGMGYVGRRAAQLFRAVGAEVWAYDPYLSEQTAIELGVHKRGLDDLLAGCRVISVHLPVTEATHNLLGARELALISDSAVFVNSARSWVVEPKALLYELVSGRFWAALDVFDTEPLPLDDPLRRLDNVLLTPHVAGRTVESYANLMADVIDELERLFKGQPLRYAVTPEMLSIMA